MSRAGEIPFYPERDVFEDIRDGILETNALIRAMANHWGMEFEDDEEGEEGIDYLEV